MSSEDPTPTEEPTPEPEPEPTPEPTPEPEPVVTATGDAAVVAAVTKDLATDMWAVDVTINHPDQTVVRVDGRSVWTGTR